MAARTTGAEFTITPRYKTDRRDPVRWIYSHAVHHWWLALIAFTSAVGNAVLATVTPLYIGRIFNLLQAAQVDLKVLGTSTLIILVARLGQGIFQWLRNFGFEIVSQRIERDIREELFTSLMGKSMTFHSLQPVGDTMARATNDVREVNFMFSPGINLVIGSLSFLVMPILAAPRIDRELILTPFLFLVLYVFALRQYLHQLEPVTDEVRKTFGNLNMRLSEALDGIETVKAGSQEKGEKARFRQNTQQYRTAVVRQGDVEAKYIPMLLFSLALAGGLLHSMILFRSGRIDLGDVVAYFGLLLLLDFPTFISLFAYSQISLGLSGARRILDLLNREENLDQNLSGHSPEVRGEVEFRNVSFSYNNSGPGVDQINFHVTPGQTVAIVGQTGSGKTTLTKLINRIYDVNRGQVLIDGIDVKDWNLEALRHGISVIEQDIFLFSRSISENVAFGKPGSTDEEVESAAKSAQADEFIRSFSTGYQTKIGERGVTLSGGQRQRLALARAFMTDPRILILDDSTSAIDSNTEDRIQQAIFTASRGRTTFLITHRLSQIRWADLIIVMRKGKVAAIGTHDELMRYSDAYQQIFSEG